MASLVRDPGGRKRLCFFGLDGMRKALRLGRCTVQQAQAFKLRIESLIAAGLQNSPIDPDLARWVGELPEATHARLLKLGLVDARLARTVAGLLSLGDLCDQFVKDRDDVGQNTRAIYELTRRNLCDFFGRGKPIATLTPYDADQWRRELARRGLAEATIRKRCSVAKQFLATAVKRRAISENPFTGLKSAAIANESRRYFLSRQDAEKILAACPDAEWRLIFALARFGGLRTPSETLALKWSDIGEDRIVVHSSKTARHEGKGVRILPLFPELREPLRDCFEQAPEGGELVLSRHRQPNCNLRTAFLRIVERAGLTPWPKLFQNLRGTRETELAEVFPLHIVTSWMGHSTLVAARHYLQVTEEHFRRAVQGSQNAAQSEGPNAGKPGQVVGSDLDASPDLPQPAGVCERLPLASSVLPGAVPSDLKTAPKPLRAPILPSEILSPHDPGAYSGALREIFARYGLPDAACDEILSLLEGI